MGDSKAEGSTEAAVQAYRHGFAPVPIRAGDKVPYAQAWPQLMWESEEQVRSAFSNWANDGVTNIGLILGVNGLVDVDLDHPLAMELAEILLPKTPMMSGRRGRPKSHYWYKVEDELPAYRKYILPDLVNPPKGEKASRVAVELRSSFRSHQTVIPPSVHPTGEAYEWVGEPWGGEKGPAIVEGRYLARTVAFIGLLAPLLEKWPQSGSRHEAYLALAGGLLRYGETVHPFWEKNLPLLIQVIAAVTHDEDGASTRIGEVVPTTIRRLREEREGSGAYVIGFGKLAEIIGNEHAELVKRRKGDIEALTNSGPEPIRREATFVQHTEDGAEVVIRPDGVVSALPPEIRNPMEERVSSWDRVDMEPYILGQVVMPEPIVLVRSDGKGLMYPGRLNMLYGLSEGGKSWVALLTCQQEMSKGGRVMYIDFEDSPEGTWHRLKLIGVGAEDVTSFAYVHPEDPISDMMRGRFSQGPDEEHKARSSRFRVLLESYDPTLIVVDGMTTLYNSHGLDTNAAGDTDVIGSWLKSLARNGRTTALVIDHTGKSSVKGDAPIGAHHKIAMIQGTALQVVPKEQPMPGALGRIELIVHKDRPGAVRVNSGPPRGTSRIQTAAFVFIDSTTPGMTRLSIDPPNPNDLDTLDDEEVNGRAIEKAESQRRKAEYAREVRQMRDSVMLAYGGEDGKSFSAKELHEVLSLEWVNSQWSPLLEEVVKQLADEGQIVKTGGRGNARYEFHLDEEA